MIFEIIGSRILSPFIGTSTYVWTSLIGVILASLSLGYWLGGRIADRHPSVKVLASVIFAAGGLISVTVLVKDISLSIIAGAAVGLELKALIATLLLFAPASICLGIVTPFAVRLKMTSVETTGRTVGRLYAISTVGSIVGTFFAGFFLIPFIGSVRTLYLIAASLIILSISLFPLAVTKLNIAAVMLFGLGVAANEANIYLLQQRGDVHDFDTEYSRVRVFKTRDAGSGKEIRAIATDPYFVQSAMFLESDDLVFDYGRYYHLIRHFKPGFEKTLIIGGAGYTFPKEYLRVYENARIDVVEIDPGMTSIARDYFRLTNDPRMNIIHEDGRMFINRADSKMYDAVLMDAFGSLFSVPAHLTTLEAVSNIHRILKDDGIVIFNLGSAVTGKGSRFLNAEVQTYRQVFPHVLLFKVNSAYPDDSLQNLIIVALKSPDKSDSLSEDPIIASLLTHRYEPQSVSPEPVLTDDLAPVEYYNSLAQNLFLANR
ncbi:MAG: fused MFS/spermidine synthase [Pyrinomonadaceae bacterium]